MTDVTLSKEGNPDDRAERLAEVRERRRRQQYIYALRCIAADIGIRSWLQLYRDVVASSPLPPDMRRACLRAMEAVELEVPGAVERCRRRLEVAVVWLELADET